jgi:hypothetical protein
MGYFARIDENNVVQQVIVVDSAEYANEIFGGNWVETIQSKDKNFASNGSIYVPALDNFMRPDPTKNGNYAMLDVSTLQWKKYPDTYSFFGPKPKLLITNDLRMFKWNEKILDWDELPYNT